MQLIEKMISILPDGPVSDIRIGAFWTAVVVDGPEQPRCGLVSTMGRDSDHHHAGGAWTAPETLAWHFWGGNLSLVIDENDQPHVIQRKGSAIYEITRASEHGVTKRYHAGTGQQLASRIDGDLYYHLLDPSGTSLTMVDKDGVEAAHILYDAYGGVLESTFTDPALAIALAGQGATAGPDTGLVHLGGGRW